MYHTRINDISTFENIQRKLLFLNSLDNDSQLIDLNIARVKFDAIFLNLPFLNQIHHLSKYLDS